MACIRGCLTASSFYDNLRPRRVARLASKAGPVSEKVCWRGVPDYSYLYRLVVYSMHRLHSRFICNGRSEQLIGV